MIPVQNNRPLQTRVAIRNIRRLLGGPDTVASAALHTITICPKETAEVAEALFLPDQIDRITGAYPNTTIEFQVDQATGRQLVHEPTIAYYLCNVTVFNGSIYSKKLKLPISDKNLSPSDGFTHRYEAALASSMVGTQYFGHWLRDDCVQYLLAEKHGVPVSLGRPHFSHEENYASMFGQNWKPTYGARLDYLIVYQDFAQNSSKRKRYQILRDRVRAKIEPKKAELVYLRRGKAGESRLIDGEERMLERLTSAGFEIADVEKDALPELLAKLSGAKVVVSMEGSHISHCCFTMPSKSLLIVLQPADRFNGVHRGWSEALDIRFGFVVGSKSATGYLFSAAEILKTAGLSH